MPLKKYQESDSLKKSIIAMAVILMITLTGCGKNDHNSYSKIYESYGNIENYSADIKVTVSSDAGESEYTAKQYYAAPDLYRIDYTSEGLEKISCVLSGETLKFKDADGTVTEFKGYVPNEKYYIFITDFMERYCKSESAKSLSKGSSTILQLPEETKDPNRALMKLWVKNKTNEPLKLITYDDGGEERVKVEFENFKMNGKIDKKIFEL